MKEAFYYMFSDNKFAKKALTYFIAVLMAAFCTQYASNFMPICKGCVPPLQYYIWFLAGIVLMFVPQGYYISCIRTLSAQNENPELPFFDVKRNFLQGFKFYISILILTLVAGITGAIIATILAIIFAILKMSALGFVIMLTIISAIMLVIIFFTLAFTKIFAETNSWLSFLQFKKAANIISANPKNYWLAFGLIVALGIVTGFITSFLPSIICGALSCPKIVLTIVIALFSSVIGAYTVFVWAYIIAKWLKQA